MDIINDNNTPVFGIFENINSNSFENFRHSSTTLIKLTLRLTWRLKSATVAPYLFLQSYRLLTSEFVQDVDLFGSEDEEESEEKARVT